MSVGLSVAVALGDSVDVAVAVAIALGVLVDVAVAIGVALGVLVEVAVAVRLGVELLVTVDVAVAVRLAVAVLVRVAVRVAVGNVQLPAPMPPLQAAGMVHPLSVCRPGLTASHQPFGRLVLPVAHAWQVAVQAASQQIPSTQLLEAHWASLAQAAPAATSQLPAPLVPLHAEDPLHPFSVCSVPTTVAHTPSCMPVLAAAHD